MDNIDFNFVCSTKVFYKNEGVSEIGDIISGFRFKKVYLVYGGHSLKDSGTYEKIVKSLNDKGIEYKEYSGIDCNPDVSDVINMRDECRIFKPELILACGGGSVIDASKSLAHAYYYDGNPIDFNRHKVEPLHALPVGVILTLAASGSEMSDSCVISDRKHGFKSGFNTTSNYPLFALMDPSLTLSVPMSQVGYGLADMFSHAMERYFSLSDIYQPSDYIALSVMKSIVDVSKAVLEDPKDIVARRNMMICGSLAHNGIASFGKTRRFIVHKAEHMLSGLYPELPHGLGIALLLVPYLTINKERFKKILIPFGSIVFGVDDCTEDKAIAALDSWIHTLSIPQSFDDLWFKVSEEHLQKAYGMLKLK